VLKYSLKFRVYCFEGLGKNSLNNSLEFHENKWGKYSLSLLVCPKGKSLTPL
jgi:hypothetical protein